MVSLLHGGDGVVAQPRLHDARRVGGSPQAGALWGGGGGGEKKKKKKDKKKKKKKDYYYYLLRKG